MDIKISPKSLPKSPHLIEPEVFARLRVLFTDRSWLIDLEKNFFDIWNLCVHDKQQDLIEDLIRRFLFMTSRDLKHHGESIAKQLTDKWNVDPAQTLVIAFAGDDEPDGSQVLLQSIKDKFATVDGWSSDNFINKITSGAYRMKDGETAILIDDFTGTGDTAQSKIAFFTKKLKERNITKYKIYFITLVMMEASKAILDSLPIESSFACIYLRRGISDEYTGDMLSVRTQSMIELEKLLAESFRGRDLVQFSFGYKRSEALYSLEAYNTPNNVFPIFWWPALKSGKLRNPMFKHFIG